MTAAEYDALPGHPRWVDPEEPSRSKSEIVALYRLHHLVDSVAEDAKYRKKK